jgi:hypothetical protein
MLFKIEVQSGGVKGSGFKWGQVWSRVVTCGQEGPKGVKWGQVVGPSGVRALPLAAGIKVGGHYKWHFFLSLSSSGSLLILPEGVVVGFCNFAWAPK